MCATDPDTLVIEAWENRTKELFFRWASLGALAPVMRTHHGRAISDNWRWNKDAETIAHFKRWADLHTRLFPLWRGLQEAASATGAPILRPVVFEFPSDRRQDDVKDAYMVGEALLVAPVVTASVTDLADVTGVRSVLVLLGDSGRFREGDRWYTVTSEGAARGPITVRTGTERTRGLGRLVVGPGTDGRIEVVDGAGAVHTVTMSGSGLDLENSEVELWFEEE